MSNETIGGIKRLSLYLAGQLASAVNITGGTISGATITNSISSATNKRVTAQTDVTASTTLVTVTGLSVSLVAGGTYILESYLPATAGASGGAKVAFGTSDTLTATSISYTGKNFNGTTLNANTTTTTLGNAVGAATAVTTDLMLNGTIVVNAAGTLTVQIAQNASNATPTSALVNGYLRATRIA